MWLTIKALRKTKENKTNQKKKKKKHQKIQNLNFAFSSSPFASSFLFLLPACWPSVGHRLCAGTEVN